MSEVSRWTDTIAACITPPGKGAVSVIRISGPKTLEVVQSVAPFCLGQYRFSYYGHFCTGDDGLCVLFAEGSSFTGELSAELSCHGSPVSVTQLLEACYQNGARAASNGEFSLKAFLNGTIDLSQAEGIRETVDAITERQIKQAHRLRSGKLAHELDPITNDVRYCLTTIEALTDFSEELGDVDHEQKVGRLNSASTKIDKFLEGESLARRIRQGALVVLAGKPNAGKSSLLNAFLKNDRAIVTPIPGTTRDALEEQVTIDGIPVRLVDTAGLHNTSDEVERLGIIKTEEYMYEADLILYLYDSSVGWTSEDEHLFSSIESKGIIVATKSDLKHQTHGISISNLNGSGFPELINAIKISLGANSKEPLTLVDRHYEILREVKLLIHESINTIETPIVPDDLAAVTLRSALRKLGELTGESAPADVLEQIFSQFCIGK